jgi:hypothetical protein
MITIHNLEVRFEIEGSDEEAAFARLFQRYMRMWAQAERVQRERAAAAEKDRALGDRGTEGAAWH